MSDSAVEYYWSDTYKRRMVLHQPALVEKAIRMANWHEERGGRSFLSPPLPLEDVETRPGQRLWFCTALKALTRDEVIKLYDSLIESTQVDDETGGDFTPAYVREHLPHIYGPKT